MDALGAVRWMMKQEQVNGVELSERLGKSKGCVSMMLYKNKDIKAGTLARIAAVLGYEVVLKRGPVELHITG